MTADCLACELAESSVGDDRSAERLRVGQHWRVALVDRSLPGWVVVVPHRHTESIADLTAVEAEELGPVLRRASVALGAVTGCAKAYVLQFAESPRARHVHFHVVPRMSDLGEDERGPAVMRHLQGASPLDGPARERLTAGLRDALQDADGGR